MTTYTDILTANKEDLTDLINDQIQFTKTTLKDMVIWISLNEVRFNELMLKVTADKYFSKEFKSFKIMVKEAFQSIATFNTAETQDYFEAKRKEAINNNLR